jgi:hypothetical protein
MATANKSIFVSDGKNEIHDGIEHAPGGGKALLDPTDTACIPFRLDRFASLDLMPARAWPAPQLALSPESDAGPVLIEVAYRVAEAHVEHFILAMRDVREERRRDGAVTWGLYRDLGDPTRFVETFVFESWLEHLRQHERVTIADEGFRRQVHRFLVGKTEPEVKHLIGANNGSSPPANVAADEPKSKLRASLETKADELA